MNRRLTDPFLSAELPEVIEEYLDQGTAKCIAFNRRGTLLAAGTEEGDVVIWDFETRGVAKVLQHDSGRTDAEPTPSASGQAGAPTAPGAPPSGANVRKAPGGSSGGGSGTSAATCVAWSRSGRQLVAGYADQRLVVWDVAAGSKAFETSFGTGGAVTAVSVCEAAPLRVTAALATGPPMLVDAATGAARPLMSISLDPAAAAGTAPLLAPAPACALLSRRGALVFLGQTKGVVAVLDAATLGVLDVIKVPGSPRIVGMRLSRKGTHLLLNCHDRTVRLYEVAAHPLEAARTRPGGSGGDRLGDGGETGGGGAGDEGAAAPRPLDAEALAVALAAAGGGAGPSSVKAGSLLRPSSPLLSHVHSFQNAVERNAWRSVAMSGDGEHVAAASAAKSDHFLYLWSRVYGKLERILEGPRNEAVLDVAWHPCCSMLASVSSNGQVYIWARIYNENWSAFAPGFQELDENVEYVEAEDEFDLNGREEQAAAERAKANQEEEEQGDVDVWSREEAGVFTSDDEDPADQLHHLPAFVEPEPPPAPAANEEGGSGGSDSEDGGQGSEQQSGQQAEATDVLGGPRKRKARWEKDWEDIDEATARAEAMPPKPRGGGAGGGGRRGRGRGRGRVGRPPLNRDANGVPRAVGGESRGGGRGAFSGASSGSAGAGGGMPWGAAPTQPRGGGSPLTEARLVNGADPAAPPAPAGAPTDESQQTLTALLGALRQACASGTVPQGALSEQQG